MTRLLINLVDSELYEFAKKAHEARYPAFAWKAVACDIMGLPVGSRPTVAQMMGIKCSWMTLWQELVHRFPQMTTVRWAEHLECEEENLHNSLIYLGASPDQVAERLHRMGIVGDVMESCDCPLAHFFRGIYSAWFTNVYRERSVLDFVEVSHPHAVEQFVAGFDVGTWSILDLFPDRVAIL